MHVIALAPGVLFSRPGSGPESVKNRPSPPLLLRNTQASWMPPLDNPTEPQYTMPIVIDNGVEMALELIDIIFFVIAPFAMAYIAYDAYSDRSAK